MPPKETVSCRAEDLGFYVPGHLEAFLCGKLASLLTAFTLKRFYGPNVGNFRKLPFTLTVWLLF